MATIKEYLKYYKSLTFNECKLNINDVLLFTELSYIDWHNIVPEDNNKITLKEAFDIYQKTKNVYLSTFMKGNIAIIKHTDDGKTKIETPENGAEFEVYLKSSGSFEKADKDERDTIVCDENGFAQTKDMPYGVYTVHQTKGWEGRELMKDFDVFISQYF